MVQYAEKGSKLMLQLLLTKTEYKDVLINELNERDLDTTDLIRFSPSKDKNGVFHEHQLNKTILRKLKINPDALNDFWPARQPQWDAILVNKNGNDDFDTVYLIEAKSHLTESISGTKFIDDGNSAKKDNYNTKRCSIEEFVKSKFKIDFEETKWMEKYYQIANRLAFHQKLKDLYKDSKQEISVKLIFLNFINDPTWKDEGKAVENVKNWKNKFAEIFKDLGIIQEKLQDVEIITINAENYKIKQ